MMIKISLYDLFETLIDKTALTRKVFNIEEKEPYSTPVPQLQSNDILCCCSRYHILL